MKILPQIKMPGESYSQEFKQLNKEERATLQSLKNHVGFLAGTVGERNMFVPNNLKDATVYIEKIFRAQGHKVSSHAYILKKGPLTKYSRNGFFPGSFPVQFSGG